MVDELEGHIKKYLCGRFEDERIASVKKTTNWYRQADRMLREIFNKDPKEFGADFAEKFNKSKKKKKTMPTEALQEVTEGAMDDFETYMFISRQGGTASELRGELKNSEQKI